MSSKKLDKEWESLGRLLDKLDPEHGIVGRRNSRKAVIAKLRRVRTLMDRDYPTIAKKRKATRANRTMNVKIRDFEKRMDRLRYVSPEKNRLGKIEFSNNVGIKVHQPPETSATAAGYIPLWLDIMIDAGNLTKAAAQTIAKSRNDQKAIESIWRLSQ